MSRAKGKRYTTGIHLLLEEKMLEDLRAKAETNSTTINQLIRDWIIKGLKEGN